MKTPLAMIAAALLLATAAFAVPMDAPHAQAGVQVSKAAMPSSYAQRLTRMEQRFHAR